jgi:hypothetical protein
LVRGVNRPRSDPPSDAAPTAHAPKWLGEAAADAERQIMTAPQEPLPVDEHEPAREA